MEIIVEIGTEEQKELICKELSFIENISKKLETLPPITQIIVPKDFDNKVNNILGIDNYESERCGHSVIAKVLPTNDGIYVLFSKELYSDLFDEQVRCQIFLHEFIHTLNKLRFPNISKDSKADKFYFERLYILFDEYKANRKSLKITEKIFPKLSQKYKRYVALDLKSLIKTICDDSSYLQKLREEISKFRLHIYNLNEFLKCIEDIFDEAPIFIIKIYTYLDNNTKLDKLNIKLEKSNLINHKTISLIDYFRLKYEKGEYNLFDGREIIEDFMTNFGVRFEDAPQGLYCHVLDI